MINNRKSMLSFGSALVLCLLVAGCGSSHRRDRDLSGKNNTAEPVAAADAFIVAVQAVIAATSDETEPVSIEATTPTTPDDTAPLPI